LNAQKIYKNENPGCQIANYVHIGFFPSGNFYYGVKTMIKFLFFFITLIVPSYSWGTETFVWGTLDLAEVNVELYKEYGDRPGEPILMGRITQLRVTNRDVRILAYHDKYLMIHECQFPKTRFLIKDGKSVEEALPGIDKIVNTIKETILKKDPEENEKSTTSRITCFIAKSPLYRMPDTIVYPDKLLLNSLDGEGNTIGDTKEYQTLEE